MEIKEPLRSAIYDLIDEYIKLCHFQFVHYTHDDPDEDDIQVRLVSPEGEILIETIDSWERIYKQDNI